MNASKVLVMWLCLVNSGCALMRSPEQSKPAPPQANLIESCDEALPYPGKDEKLSVWRPILEANAAAQNDCRAKHKELSDWAVKVTQ